MMEKIAQALAEEREREGHHYLVGDLLAYCDNPNCSARQIKVRIKIVDDDPTTIHCPLCGREPIFDGYQRLKLG
jgi:hypothetical protein